MIKFLIVKYVYKYTLVFNNCYFTKVLVPRYAYLNCNAHRSGFIGLQFANTINAHRLLLEIKERFANLIPTSLPAIPTVCVRNILICSLVNRLVQYNDRIGLFCIQSFNVIKKLRFSGLVSINRRARLLHKRRSEIFPMRRIVLFNITVIKMHKHTNKIFFLISTF